MENNDHDKNVEKFINWSKTGLITAIITGVLGIITALMAILNKFTDLKVKAPFFYSKLFMWIMLAFLTVLVTLEILCYVQARKYKKLIEKSETNQNESRYD